MKKLLIVASIAPLTFASEHNPYPDTSYYQSAAQTPEQTACCLSCLNGWRQLSRRHTPTAPEPNSIAPSSNSEFLLPQDKSVLYSAVHYKPERRCIIL